MSAWHDFFFYFNYFHDRNYILDQIIVMKSLVCCTSSADFIFIAIGEVAASTSSGSTSSDVQGNGMFWTRQQAWNCTGNTGKLRKQVSLES